VIASALVFSTPDYAGLAELVAARAGFDLGEIERKEFPDGEHYRRIDTPVAGRNVVILGGTVSDRDTLEIYDLACAASKYGARTLTLVIPYFGYSTMERAAKPGEVVTAKTRARLLSAIPPAAAGNRIVLLDLHSEGITHYFEGDVAPLHVYAKPVVSQAARQLGGEDFVLACTDAGRAKWVESLANDMGVPAAFVLKRRLSGDEVELAAVNAQVGGKRVVIYDDMIRTGGSLLQAARAYREAGAVYVAGLATHGVFPPGVVDKIGASGVLDALVVTDSHPAAERYRGEFLEVVTVADLLADQIGDGLP
jgi:ribose-phosphate pyrophosphokinase